MSGDHEPDPDLPLPLRADIYRQGRLYRRDYLPGLRAGVPRGPGVGPSTP